MLKKLFNALKKPSVQNHCSDETDIKSQSISANLNQTVATFKSIYNYPLNFDINIRELHIASLEKNAVVFFIQTIVDKTVIEDHIIRPLILNENKNKSVDQIISAPSLNNSTKIKDITEAINKGNAILFVDGICEAIVVNTTLFQGRPIEAPENEIVLRGPKESFNENLDTNISLIRKKIKNEALTFESLVVGERSHNELIIGYINDLASDELLQQVRERINNIDVDAVQNLGLLEQYIEERQLSFFPTILYTERPDRVASYIEDGYIVLLMNNSPGAIILPATFWSFFHASEDHYLRFMYGNFTRLIRLIGLFITLFTSALYIAVTNFHIEMIPSDLLLAIAATREKVPFPALVEVLLMELAFELIREAGLRVPTPIGPTIGIVGALIIGTAAVDANIVSPIVVIAVALGGLSSFVVGDISMNFAIRMTRILFIIAGGFFGIFGMAALLIVGLFYLSSLKSFGVPYFAPLTPGYGSREDTLFRKLLKNEQFRPGYLKPKDKRKKRSDAQ